MTLIVLPCALSLVSSWKLARPLKLIGARTSPGQRGGAEGVGRIARHRLIVDDDLRAAPVPVDRHRAVDTAEVAVAQVHDVGAAAGDNRQSGTGGGVQDVDGVYPGTRVRGVEGGIRSAASQLSVAAGEYSARNRIGLGGGRHIVYICLITIDHLLQVGGTGTARERQAEDRAVA